MNRISRRNFLKAAGVGAAALGLAACGGSSSSTASSTASSAATSSAVAADVTIKVAAIAGGTGTDAGGAVHQNGRTFQGSAANF